MGHDVAAQARRRARARGDLAAANARGRNAFGHDAGAAGALAHLRDDGVAVRDRARACDHARTRMTSQRALVTWALATFHTTLFVLLAITVLYGQGRFGATLASLNTLLGLGLFVVLWTSTYLTTRRALAKADLLTGDFDRVEFVRRALRYGAVNGVVFLAVLAAALIVGSMAATPA